MTALLYIRIDQLVKNHEAEESQTLQTYICLSAVVAKVTMAGKQNLFTRRSFSEVG